MIRGAVILRMDGVAVPDAQDCFPAKHAVPCNAYWETQRAVAEWIALGAWCDRLAWWEILGNEYALHSAEWELREARAERKRERDARKATRELQKKI